MNVLALACDRHPAPIGVPCAADGTCCARRIARALFIEAAGEDPAARAERTTRGEPGKAAPPVLDEDAAARGRS